MCLGVPGKITEIYTTNGLLMGKIDFDGAIIHVGFALSLLSEAEAQETLTLLRQISNFEAEIESPE
jgi:hydrogenase expression/formation protein HypC